MTSGTRAALFIAGGTALIGGGARWEGEYDKAQLLRGRDKNVFEDIGNYLLDTPHYINSHLIDPQETRQPWEVPFENTIPADMLLLVGGTVLLMAWKGKV